MTLDDFILTVFCLVDDYLQTSQSRPLRQRGPAPKLHDSEVLTIELVGEFLNMDQDTAIFWHFRRYHATDFPGLVTVDRSTFVRQAANLWVLKQRLHQHLVEQLDGNDALWHVDSMPLHACQFGRASYCQRFFGQASYGRDPVIKQTFYGFRLHLRINSFGAIGSVALAPANVAETEALWDLDPPRGSVGVGDRGYWSPCLMGELAEQGVVLLASYKRKSNDPNPDRVPRLLRKQHRLIETVNGQLAGRYRGKRTWAKDLWHLCHRVIRKVLSHTIAVWVNVRLGRSPLQHAGLITE